MISSIKVGKLVENQLSALKYRNSLFNEVNSRHVAFRATFLQRSRSRNDRKSIMQLSAGSKGVRDGGGVSAGNFFYASDDGRYR